MFATSNRRSTYPHFKTADKNKMFKWGIKQPVKTKNEANTMLVTQADKNKMFKWGIKQPVKTKNEANTMLVTQAFSQDAKILACVPLSPINGGVQSPPLIEG
ncbi:hypothetical protein A0U40_07800 [[Bacillus] sp. KCTC 13219]|nr:hypothetical protein A0U40_07800 [[Bacillus] sp. KCTC 13219]